MIIGRFALPIRGDFIASIPFIVIAIVSLLVQDSGLSAVASGSAWIIDIAVSLGISFIILSGAIAACMYSIGRELPTNFGVFHKGPRGGHRTGG
jgi:hypothetical protein